LSDLKGSVLVILPILGGKVSLKIWKREGWERRE